MDIRQDDSLHTTLSSLDLGTTLDEIDCSTDSPLQEMSRFYKNASLTSSTSRFSPPPLPTTPKPMVAITRSTVEDFLLMEYSFRGSFETSLDGTSTDSYSDVDNSMRGGNYRVPCLTKAILSSSKLKTFDRNSPTRIGTRKRHSQRSLSKFLCVEDSPSTPCPAKPRSLRVRLKRFIQKKITKTMS